MKKTILGVLGTLVLSAGLTGCFTMKHRVGNGPSTGAESEERQWFILWGLVPLNDVDSQEMAGSATNYEVQTQQSFLDVIINIFTGYVSIVSRTVTVTK